MFESLILALALSLDGFAACLAYGAGGIHIPRASAMTISGVCSALLAAALLLGGSLARFLEPALCSAVGAVIMLLLGAVKLFDSTIKRLIRRAGKSRVQFRLFDATFILAVYANPARADHDRSRVLSPREAVSLSLALSLDGLTIGFGAGLGQVEVLWALVFSFAITLLAVVAGGRLGSKLSLRLGGNMGWLSGLMLMAMAGVKLIGGI